MIVASTRTAIAIPKPISFVTMTEVNAKAPHTITNNNAAFVITPPVFDNPRAPPNGYYASVTTLLGCGSVRRPRNPSKGRRGYRITGLGGDYPESRRM